MQRQAILTVRLVINEDVDLREAEAILLDALEEAELMAHVEGKMIVQIKEDPNE